jgi:hypothetical protein
MKYREEWQSADIGLLTAEISSVSLLAISFADFH